MDLRLLTIESLIVHEIPSGLAGATGSPDFSEVESPLDDEVRNFFEERIRDTLNHSAFAAVFLEETDSPVPQVVEDQLGKSPSDFVAASKQVAQRLFDAQSGATSPGLLTMMRCKIAKKRALAILKLEKEHGVRVEEQKHKGKTTLSVKHIKDLMLTEKTRVFKTGLFHPTADGDVEILVCDFQRPATQAVASFFLVKFLGCELAEAPGVLTKRFMDATEGWINEEVSDSGKKSRYQVALMAEMESNRNTVTPKAFAKTHLEVSDRAPYVAALEKRGASTKCFEKDSDLVRNRLRRIQYDFKNRTAVLCPPDAIGETVRVSGNENGETKIEISGELDKVSGRGG